MDYLERVFGANEREVWDTIAVGMDDTSGEGPAWTGTAIRARVGQWTVTLDTDQAYDQNASVVTTRLRAPYINKDGFRFHISPEGLVSRFGKLLGVRDVQVGDDDYDRAFLIRANDGAKVKQFLANPSIRAAMLELGRVSLCVKDDEGWFGTDFPEGVDELYLEVPGLVATPVRLRRHFEFFALCLRQLCHIGSAYPEDPKLSLA